MKNTTTIPMLPLFPETWQQVRDGNPAAKLLHDRHYSKYWYADGRRPRKFIGPGEYLALVTPCGKAVFVWKKFRDASGQTGVNCSIFRNESPRLSSELILEAEKIAWQRWPGERLYTYVNPRKIRSQNPGCCFKKAGWKVCGLTKARKLIILYKNYCQ